MATKTGFTVYLEHQSLKVFSYIKLQVYILDTFAIFFFFLISIQPILSQTTNILISRSKFSGTRKFYFDISVVWD